MGDYISIRNLAKTGLMGETELRRRLAQNQLPGIYVGDVRRCFKVDVEAFKAMLKMESLQALKQGGRVVRAEGGAAGE